MTQSRSNRLPILHCHEEGSYNLNLAAVANGFPSKHDAKIPFFGNFGSLNLLNCELMNTRVSM